ncbi:MAG: winged helix-turn-helix transcriptional regulator [Ruminococcaceae bacterium]|nr:winged helix-turn-helix transcriptional regulator [Oscillospiraceae bacterium]
MVHRFEDFVSLINTAYKDIQKIKSYEVKELGLKSSHVMCMFYLGQNENGLTANQLCEKCKEDKAAISRNLKYLAEKGYVTVAEDETRKYKLCNVLTDEGREAYAKLEVLISNSVERFSRGLSNKEREAFQKYLGKIIENFDNFFEEKEKADK